MPMTTKQYQETMGIEERHVTVFFRKTESPTSFFCVNCRNKIMQHQYEVAMLADGDMVVSFPVEIKCSNKKCNTKYHFEFPL